MSANLIIKPKWQTTGRLRLFTLYEDFDSGVRARQMTKELARRIGPDWDVQGEMWKIGTAKGVGRLHQIMAQDAIRSDALLVAATSLDKGQETMVRWLYSILGWKVDSAMPRMLIGLFGDEQHPPRRADWLVSQLQVFATRNGIEFTWHCLEQSTSASQWLDGVARSLATPRGHADHVLSPAA